MLANACEMLVNACKMFAKCLQMLANACKLFEKCLQMLVNACEMFLYYVFLYRIPEGNPHCQQLLGLDMDICFVIITEMGGGGGGGPAGQLAWGGTNPHPCCGRLKLPLKFPWRCFAPHTILY